MAGPGRPRTGGRKKGTPNKATAEVKALAQCWGEQAISTLATLMEKGDTDQVRISAARELLDRGYGRPRQSMELDAAIRGPSLLEILTSLNERDAEESRGLDDRS